MHSAMSRSERHFSLQMTMYACVKTDVVRHLTLQPGATVRRTWLRAPARCPLCCLTSFFSPSAIFSNQDRPPSLTSRGSLRHVVGASVIQRCLQTECAHEHFRDCDNHAYLSTTCNC